ncbi:hypothetical protein ZOD2009_19028 [Haladaptatus paucihalophilus DX253]|uniref:Uncharacterized protein n=1 Tax=Haladaptatus paucihalophilus DX253 TaxID=797209 RepID=E7QYB5_HALPU|nr:hypothetical protein [Haladaptatus paucihalophilus]EFW90440.1 hypothetical protein ZOD2009_19028 [Haladaptatus paucihalophilus DX253]SHL68613.1 hypothetical protein SAMN05444342_4412 [Haladaptatus paucihalophilus DX253]
MSNPEEVIESIFVLAVGLVVLVSLYKSFYGGGLGDFTLLVGDLAIPFVVVLIGLYFVFRIKEAV